MFEYMNIPIAELKKQVVLWLKEQQKIKGFEKAVVGISGGKDSSVVAALCVEAFGKENVLGVMMPNGEQKDISDSQRVCDILGIPRMTLNINGAFESIIGQVPFATTDSRINLPARLRMASLHCIAQGMKKAFVIGTCNRSEDIVGYATWGGDNFASIMPIAKLTTEEVIAIGDELGLPLDLTHKTPVDGLQELSDEQKLGFTYHEVNELIRENKQGPHYEKIMKMFNQNRFKLDYLRLPAYIPPMQDTFTPLLDKLPPEELQPEAE